MVRSWGLKRPGHNVDYPPSSAEAKKEWSYTSTPPTCLHDFDRDIFTVLPVNTLENFQIWFLKNCTWNREQAAQSKLLYTMNDVAFMAYHE